MVYKTDNVAQITSILSAMISLTVKDMFHEGQDAQRRTESMEKRKRRNVGWAFGRYCFVCEVDTSGGCGEKQNIINNCNAGQEVVLMLRLEGEICVSPVASCTLQ